MTDESVNILHLYLLTNYATKDLASFYIIAAIDSIDAFNVLQSHLRTTSLLSKYRATKLGISKKAVKTSQILLAINNVRTASINPLIKSLTTGV